jgi:probable rRNA maturation factor
MKRSLPRGRRLSAPSLASRERDAAEAAESPQSTITLDIAVERASPLWDALAEAEALAERAIAAAAASCGVKLRDDAEVGVQLVDDGDIRALNARWRGFDKPTNVLSFPASPVEKLASAPMLGDIVVAYETTRREADDERISLSDHFVHLVVHGFLHLVGFDHEDDAEAESMEALETRVLKGMAIADPYGRSVAVERA